MSMGSRDFSNHFEEQKYKDTIDFIGAGSQMLSVTSRTPVLGENLVIQEDRKSNPTHQSDHVDRCPDV